MKRDPVRATLDAELRSFVAALYETAHDAADHVLANIVPPTRCTGIHLHQVQWHDNEPVAVRLYIETSSQEGITTDALSNLSADCS